jgi:hypothetical protein
MTRTTSLLLAALFVVGLASPAAADPQWVPTFHPERTYLACAATGKVGNAAKHVSGPVQLTTTRPTASETSGAGCHSFDWTFDPGMGYLPPGPIGPARDAVSTITMRGTHFGNLDRLTLRMTAMSFGDPAGTWPVQLGVKIDGKDVVRWPTAVGNTKIPDGLKDVSTITVQGIGLLAERDYVQHDIEITFRYDEPWRATMWQWGVSEALSGVEFSPDSASGATVTARP